MNLDELQRKLMAAARANPASDAVPYAFEKRISALVRGRPVPDLMGVWARGLSRAAMLCVVVMLGFAAWSYFIPAASSDSLSQDVQTTLFAAVDSGSTDASPADSP
jgi:hypothetical protein